MNGICSKNVSFDLRCNELEDWLIKINYYPTKVRKQILKARAFSRGTLLDRVKDVKNNDRLVLLPTIPVLRIFRMSLKMCTYF